MSDKLILIGATTAAAGLALDGGSKCGELLTDRFGQNRPDWMRNTGIYTTTQTVGKLAQGVGGFIVALCGI
jgi:hypothetical protein